MNRKRGRPAQYVIGRDGKPIVGLSHEKSSGRFYATASKPRHYFGRDLDGAVMALRQRQLASGQSPTYAAIEVPATLPMPLALPPELSSDRQLERLRRGEPLADVIKPGQQRFTLLPEDSLWAWFRRMLLDKPAYCAEKTGIEQLGYLSDLKRPESSITLSELWSAYAARKRARSTSWSRDARRYWREFTSQVQAKTVRDIDHASVERYHEQVWEWKAAHDRSPAFVKNRFTVVTTVLRNGLKRGRDVEQIRRVLDVCKLFELPSKEQFAPHPISPVDFKKLLAAATVKFKAILLLAVNLCMYPGEIAAVLRSEIDLDQRTYVGHRPKTQVVRVGVLWQRTVTAIRTYQKAEPQDAAHLFLSSYGASYTANHLGRHFRKLRVEAGIPADVSFNNLRDGGYTAAVQGGASVDHARLLAGHRLPGVSDAYLQRSPMLVADACAAIEKHYFGSAAKPARRASVARPK